MAITSTNSIIVMNKSGKTINVLYMGSSNQTSYTSSDIKQVSCLTDSDSDPTGNQIIPYSSTGMVGYVLAWDPRGKYGGYLDISKAIPDGTPQNNVWIGVYGYDAANAAPAAGVYCDGTAYPNTDPANNTLQIMPLSSFTLPTGVTINSNGSITIGDVTYSTPRSRQRTMYIVLFIIIIIVIIAAVAGAGFWYYKKKKSGM